MNKNVIVALCLGLGLSLGFSSCKKCLKCKYVESNTQIPQEREDCGDKDRLDAFKADVIKEAGFFGVEEKNVKCEYK